MKYELVKTVDPTRLGGVRTVYKVTDGDDISYMCADFNPCPFDTLVAETMLFECDEDGTVTDWKDLWVDYGADTASTNECIEDYIRYKEVEDAEKVRS